VSASLREWVEPVTPCTAHMRPTNKHIMRRGVFPDQKRVAGVGARSAGCMTVAHVPSTSAADDDGALLVEVLRDSEQRLEELTAGEVDSLTSQDGRIFPRENERQRLEQAVQQSEQHFRFLDDLAQATRALLDPEQVLAVVARMLGERLGASRCAYADVASNKQFTILHDYTNGCPSIVGTYHLSTFGTRALETLSSGQTLVIRDVEAELLPADGADMFDAIGIKALISCPLVKEGCLRAVMAVHQTTPRNWSANEISTVEQVVERCWATIERRTAEEKLRESEALLRIAGRTARLGAWAVNVAEQRVTWSDEVCNILEVPIGIAPGLEEALSFCAPASRPIVSNALGVCLQDGTAFDLELEMLTATGRAIWVRCAGEAQRNQGGAIIQAHGAFQDITERKRTEISIKQLNRVYSVLSGINTLIVRVNDRGELFREACRIAVEVGGFRMAMIAIIDRTTMNVVPVAWMGKDDELQTAVHDVLASGAGAANTMVARAIREKRAILANDSAKDAAPVFREKYTGAGVRSLAVLPLMVGDEAMGVLALYASEPEFFHQEEMKLLTDLTNDISFAIDHIEKGERLSYLAYYDSLTGLANRVRIHERVTQGVKNAQSRGGKLALVLLDLERFKTINDTFGRQAGDALLREVAARMIVSAVDVSGLARIDGDHFAVMVSDLQTEEEVVQRLEQRVVELFGEPFRIGGSELRVSAKFGIAMFPKDGADADALFRNAEAALKNAKAGGERYLFYTNSMDERIAEKLALEHKLRRALEHEEFVLHYQPKVDLASGKVVSCEALIRWNDPDAGLVPPGKFIPILEETGLIFEVGRWALRKAIADYLCWSRAGLSAVRVAVNVSPLQLRNRGFITEIQQLIGVDAAAAAGLELEITEGMIMEDVKHSIATLQEIRAMGVTVAIDDFGTGFSSLSYLARLPVDTLKIDRSFVKDMTSGPVGLALVSTIITLAHSVKLKVVAEGVETEEQSRLLQLLKCDEAQGFLFSKAVPIETFETEFLGVPRAA
jgi:diguanylate cyclase (GGDEF)-like protein